MIHDSFSKVADRHKVLIRTEQLFALFPITHHILGTFLHPIRVPYLCTVVIRTGTTTWITRQIGTGEEAIVFVTGRKVRENVDAVYHSESGDLGFFRPK